MSWREQLRQGSFRGVAFQIASAEGELGRRTVIHELPLRDNPVAEDVGLAPRRFTLEMFVVGDDYMDQRDALIAALETAGQAVLVHPFWGEVLVVTAGLARFRESADKGGYASITQTFVRTESVAARSSPDTAAQVASASGAGVEAASRGEAHTFVGVADASITATGKNLSAAGVTGDSFGLLGKAWNLTLDTLRGARRALAAGLTTVDDLEENIDDMKDNATALLKAPTTLGSALIGIMAKLGALPLLASQANLTGGQVILPGPDGELPKSFSSSSQALASSSTSSGSSTASGTARRGPSGGVVPPNPAVVSGLVDLANTLGTFTLPDSVLPPPQRPGDVITTLREREIANKLALELAVRVGGIASCCEAAVQIEYASADEALAVRTLLVELIDDVGEDVTDDDLFGSLTDLRTAVLRHLSITAGVLPRVRTFTPNVTMPSLVIAHELYGDATRESELVTRNNIRDPLRVLGSVPLEVLSE